MTGGFSVGIAIGATCIAAIYITVFSFVKEPQRQQINALIIAGAGGTYWSGGLGFYEFPLGTIMIFLAYKGMKDYRYLAPGWIVHTVYDVLHHYNGNPIIPMAPASSAGCAICDPILAIWLYFNAPSVVNLFRARRARI